MMEMRAILRLLESTAWKRAVLVTLVRASGSTYRKPGARMLLLDDGSSAGAVAGGCLEQAIVEQAREQLSRSASRMIRMDTTGDGDVVYGYGLGCAGTIDLLLEPFDRTTIPVPLVAAQEAMSSRTRQVVATALDPSVSPRHRHVTQSSDELPAVRRIIWSDGTEIDAYVEEIVPPVHCVVFGCGPAVASLVRIAGELGWSTTVIDARAAKLNGIEADRVIAARPPELARELLTLDERTAVVLMTHNLLLDLEILTSLALDAAPYVAVVGSRKRFDWIASELGAQRREIGRLRGPAGLDIGAESPAEIALSISAEITAAFARRKVQTSSAAPSDAELVHVRNCIA